MKILSPVGNLESLKVAVNCGADEVYLGINDFNARNNIDGFNLNTLKEAVDYAHVFGVKVNLAINILFKDNELQDAINTIVEAYNMGVDSFIVQDLGLAWLVRNNYPKIELHASTQMGLHNLEGVRWAEGFGFKRVVLSRETSLEEVKRIHDNTNVEIEYFAHGALCVSFSGNCYLSSKFFDASGNRGRCKQLCRLPFSFQKDGRVIKSGYLLSAKDFMMIDRLGDLKNAGVDVLKIEGRARRPFYVASATSEYCKALNGEKFDKSDLMLGFNRKYTEGYFNGNAGVLSAYNNHIGIKVGKVLNVNSGKRFNEVIISSSRELTEKSSFKFFEGERERCVLTAYDLKEVGANKYLLTTTQKVEKGDSVHLIIDSEKEREVLDVQKKRVIKIKISARIGTPIIANIELDGECFVVQGGLLEQATKQPLKKEDIISNFSRHELFVGDLEFGEFEKVFITNKALNEFRRRCFDVVFEKLTKTTRENIKPIKLRPVKSDRRFKDFQVVFSLEDERMKQNIIYSPECYFEDDIKVVKSQVEKEGREFYLELPNFATSEDVEILRKIISKTKCKFVVNNYYGLQFAGEKVIGAGLNVFNSVSAEVLGLPIMTCESGVGGAVDFPYMTLKVCPFKEYMNASCDKCPFEDGYEMVMDNGRRMKIKRKKLTNCIFYLTK